MDGGLPRAAEAWRWCKSLPGASAALWRTRRGRRAARRMAITTHAVATRESEAEGKDYEFGARGMDARAAKLCTCEVAGKQK